MKAHRILGAAAEDYAHMRAKLLEGVAFLANQPADTWALDRRSMRVLCDVLNHAHRADSRPPWIVVVVLMLCAFGVGLRF